MITLSVTGALGHIGSRLIREISPLRVKQLQLLDNLSANRPSSLFHLPGRIPSRFIEDDIRTADLERYFEGVDVVVHLAAITNAEGSFAIRDEVEQTNYEGARRVAEACARTGARMIFISTTSVYGPQHEIVDEDCGEEELKPQSPYAESKLRAERTLEELGRRLGLRFVTCRFGTIFGASPGMRFHTAVNKFIWQACTGRPVTVWRTALHQRRPYLDLGDAVAALSYIIDHDLFNNRTYNVLTANATVDDILTVIRRSVPGLDVTYVDSPIMNQLSYTVSNMRFRQQGFRYQGSLQQGIEEVIDLFQGLGISSREYQEMGLMGSLRPIEPMTSISNQRKSS